MEGLGRKHHRTKNPPELVTPTDAQASKIPIAEEALNPKALKRQIM